MLTIPPVELGGLGNETRRFMKRYCVCLLRKAAHPFGKFPNSLLPVPVVYPAGNWPHLL